MQQRNDKTLSWHVENGQGTMAAADAVKATAINRTQSTRMYVKRREREMVRKKDNVTNWNEQQHGGQTRESRLEGRVALKYLY